MRYAYSLFMTKTNTKQRLTNRSGRTMWAVVETHARDYSKGATICGIPFEKFEQQDFNVQQTSMCGSNSDLTCKACIAGARQIVPAGVPCGFSKRSKSKLHHIMERGEVVGTITLLYSDIVIVSRGGKSETFSSYMSAWTSIMYAGGEYNTGRGWAGVV